MGDEKINFLTKNLLKNVFANDVNNTKAHANQRSTYIIN